jgi:hypothetical protein
LVVRSSALRRRGCRAAVCFGLLLACIAPSASGQSPSVDDEVLAIYQALLRDPNFGAGAFSARPVMLRRAAATMGFYISARLLDSNGVPADLQGALRNPVGPMALPNKLADERGVSIVETIDCPAAREVRERQLTLTRVGLSEDRTHALVMISNCDKGHLVHLRRNAEGWTVAREIERYSSPRSGNSASVQLPRRPSFEYVEALGCGDFVLMAWNEDSSEVLSITWSETRPADGETSFYLAKSEKGMAFRVDAFEGRQSFLRCGEDVGTPLNRVQDPTSGWLAVGGRLKLRVDRRRMTVAVEVRDLVVQSVKGDRVRAKTLRFVARLSGWAG